MTQALRILLLVAFVGGCRSAGAPSTGSSPTSTLAPGSGLHQQTMALPGGQTVRYTLFIPDDYRGDRPFPLVVALHYGGEVTPFYGGGILEILVRPALSELGAIIVAPDALDRGWNDPLDEGSVLALMDHLMSTLVIDRKRVLCTGFSMGGVGTWYLAGRHPDRFTAAVPVAGRPAVEAELKVPVYAIHARKDEVMPLGPTEAYIARVRAAGLNAELVVVDGLTHFQTDRFVEPLRAAVPWIQRVWEGSGSEPPAR